MQAAAPRRGRRARTRVVSAIARVIGSVAQVTAPTGLDDSRRQDRTPERLLDPVALSQVLDMQMRDLNLATATRVLIEALAGEPTQATINGRPFTLLDAERHAAEEIFRPFLADAVYMLLTWGIVAFGLRARAVVDPVSGGPTREDAPDSDTQPRTLMHMEPYVLVRGTFVVTTFLLGSRRRYRVYEFVLEDDTSAPQTPEAAGEYLGDELLSSAGLLLRYRPPAGLSSVRAQRVRWRHNPHVLVLDQFNTAPDALTGALHSRLVNAVAVKVRQAHRELAFDSAEQRRMDPILAVQETVVSARATAEAAAAGTLAGLPNFVIDAAPAGEAGAGAAAARAALLLPDSGEPSAEVQRDRTRRAIDRMQDACEYTVQMRERARDFVRAGAGSVGGAAERARLAGTVPGWDNYVVVPAGLTLVPITQPGTPGGVMETRELTEQEVSAALGVPRALFVSNTGGTRQLLGTLDSTLHTFQLSLRTWRAHLNYILAHAYDAMRARAAFLNADPLAAAHVEVRDIVERGRYTAIVMTDSEPESEDERKVPAHHRRPRRTRILPESVVRFVLPLAPLLAPERAQQLLLWGIITYADFGRIMLHASGLSLDMFRDPRADPLTPETRSAALLAMLGTAKPASTAAASAPASDTHAEPPAPADPLENADPIEVRAHARRRRTRPQRILADEDGGGTAATSEPAQV